jgi:ribosomal protein S12 methylthiotransferase
MSLVAVVTLGCPKNAVDSESLGGLLAAAGHEVTADVGASDVVVVNTCGFIDAARRETVDEILTLVDAKREGAGPSGIVLTGCLVARSAPELASSLPEVDALVDFAAYPRIGEVVARVAAGERIETLHGEPGVRFDPAWWDAPLAGGPRMRFGRSPWAYLKIAEGCNRGCTFCAIPLMRGRLRSRPAGVIEQEARRLVAGGVTELSLVSQDSVMWGRDSGEGDLAGLLGRLERIDGLRRVRLMYLHPQGVTAELIDRMLDSEVVVDYFDLSLQHVSERVLRGMGRWGGAAAFSRAIERIRTRDPLAGVRSTFIMGFPGESDADAAEVERFVGDAELDWVGVFQYSREPGTRSHDLPGQVPAAVARERVEAVTVAADDAMARRAATLVGAELEVLVDGFDPGENAWVARSQREAPEVDGEIRITQPAALRVGSYQRARVLSSHGADLTAEVVGARVA